MDSWQRLAKVAGRQLGLVSLGQAAGLGLSERTVQWHAGRYGWMHLHAGVYALPGSVRSYERDALAALLAVGPRAAISHWTAASLAGLISRRPRPLHLAVPVDRKAPRLDGVWTHRSRTLRTTDVLTAAQIRRTSVARTLCDLATADSNALREMVALALQSRQTTIERVESCSSRLARHPGAGRLRAVLAELRGTSSDSGFERGVRSWLRDEGFHPHPCLYLVRAEDDIIVELDIAFPDEMIFVDCLRFVWHSLPSALLSDTVRGNGIIAAGWQPLRLTGEQFAVRDPRFIRQLRGLLRQRRDHARSRERAQVAPVLPVLPVRRPRAW